MEREQSLLEEMRASVTDARRRAAERRQADSPPVRAESPVAEPKRPRRTSLLDRLRGRI
jgi:hypothetical protein